MKLGVMLLTVSMEVENRSYLQLLEVITCSCNWPSRLLPSRWTHDAVLYRTNICLTALDFNKLHYYSAKQVDLHT